LAIHSGAQRRHARAPAKAAAKTPPLATTCRAELELPPTLRLLMVTPAALQPETKESKVVWPVVPVTFEPSTLMRQSTHDFNDWPFLFVQRHETLAQLFTLAMIVEQLLLHLSGMRSGSTTSALAVKELNEGRGERCSRLVAETAATKAMGAKRKARIMDGLCKE